MQCITVLLRLLFVLVWLSAVMGMHLHYLYAVLASFPMSAVRLIAAWEHAMLHAVSFVWARTTYCTSTNSMNPSTQTDELVL